MSEAVLVAPSGPWQVDDLDRLPDSAQRYEIVDGSLLMSPPPSARHQGVAGLLGGMLRAAAPDGLAVVEATGVRVGSGLLVPDVIVARHEAIWGGAATLAARDVVLVIEIVSLSSMTMDRITKPALYAREGIPHFWRVEIEPPSAPTVVISGLADGGYAERMTVAAGDTARLDEPFSLRLAPARLTG